MLVVFAGGGPVGCESPEEGGGDPSGSSSGESEDSAVVAEAGPITVTLAEYQRFLHQSRLFAPTGADGTVPQIPERRKKSPRAQIQTVRTLLQQEAVHRLADERDIAVSETAIDRHLRESDKLSRFVAGADAAQGPALQLPEELSREMMREVARLQVLRKKLRDALLAELTTEKLWKIYRRRRDTVRVAYVSVPNSPDSSNVDRFLEQTELAKIKAYRDDHQARYRRPRLVRLALVRPPAGEEVDEATLKKAADKLADGQSAEKVAEQLELEAEPNAQLVRKENREAFGADKGATGYQTSGPRGAYAWRVEGWRKARQPELDRALKREIAADMLSQTVVPSVLMKLQPALEAMRGVERNDDGSVPDEALESLKTSINDRGMTLKTPKAFSRSREGQVPGLGLAKKVFDKAFALDAESSVVDEPILSRDRAVALMLVERNKPDRETFDKRKETFRETIVEEKRDRIVDDHVGRWMKKNEPNVQLKPVRDKYGVIKKRR
ncbi:MAG: hypothetical protein ABEN55_19760 [Bradymonadaceae bacterium]